jgi:hypothetical protein
MLLRGGVKCRCQSKTFHFYSSGTEDKINIFYHLFSFEKFPGASTIFANRNLKKIETKSCGFINNRAITKSIKCSFQILARSRNRGDMVGFNFKISWHPPLLQIIISICGISVTSKNVMFSSFVLSQLNL